MSHHKLTDGGRSQSQIAEAMCGPEHQSSVQSQLGWNNYIRRIYPIDDLSDLTDSQRTYIETLQAIEKHNPEAAPDEIAMAISLLLWEGRIWDRDGAASDVTNVAGLPLVMDYQGGEGYNDVKLTPEQEKFLRESRQVSDRQGTPSGVTHTFPAVAAMAGREGTAAGAVNTHMVTSGGDFIQDMARVIVEQDLNVFREAEARDNERAIEVAHKNAGSGRKLSECLLEEFRIDNMED
ncbi:MAG: hypothetical protein ACE366_13770 [Bradymonadia bacterium]